MKVRSSGLEQLVVRKTPNVSEQYTVSVFRPKSRSACRLLLVGFLLGLPFDHEDEGDMIFRNVGPFLTYTTV
jgi:hypothetical protein